jgi:hypothetical protein
VSSLSPAEGRGRSDGDECAVAAATTAASLPLFHLRFCFVYAAQIKFQYVWFLVQEMYEQ